MELNEVNGGSQVPVAPATPEPRCLGMRALRGPARVAHVRRVVVSATWQAVSVVKRARSCAASVSLQSVQQVTQLSDRLAQRVGMDSPFTADQMAWLAASFSAQPPLPSSASSGPPAGTSIGTVAGESAPLIRPGGWFLECTTADGVGPLPGTSSSSGTCLPLFTCVIWAWVSSGWGGGKQGCWSLACPRVGRLGQCPSHS